MPAARRREGIGESLLSRVTRDFGDFLSAAGLEAGKGWLEVRSYNPAAIALYRKIGFGDRVAMVMIGDIMTIIPGMMLINSARELLGGDFMSGLLRLAESIVLAAVIACGFALPILVFGYLGW